MARYNLNVLAYKPKNVVVRTATPVDEFHFDEVHPKHCTKAVLTSNPLYVIFNQQRLSQLGQFPLDEWINTMNNIKSDPLKELRSKVSDEDLVNFMRSRYCQKPSEIAQWFAYLTEEIDTVTAEVQAYVDAQVKTDTVQTDKVVESET